MSADLKLVLWAGEMLGQSFEWGRRDCALLALNAIDVIRGTSHADSYTGRWKTEQEARAYYRHETPSAVLANLGAVEIDKRYAGVGDLVTVPAGDWPEQTVVLMGSRALCADIERGICLLPARLFTRSEHARAWRVA